MTPAMTPAAILRRGEVLDAMGWHTTGLSHAEIVALWGRVLALLYRDMSTSGISEMLGFSSRLINCDLRDAGVILRPRGGYNHGRVPKPGVGVWYKRQRFPSLAAWCRHYRVPYTRAYRGRDNLEAVVGNR